MNKDKFSSHIMLKNITVSDSFWTNIQKLVRDTVIPYQYEALHDRIENAEKSYCIENFTKAGIISGQLRNGKPVPTYPVDKWHYDENNSEAEAFRGWVFQDSDAYKWIEAAAYSLVNEWDETLFKNAKELIGLICSAQLENGYLDTLYIINNPKKIFTNLKDFHELYCFGHLAEAAVAFYDSTGDRELLDAACRYADLLCETFGEDKKRGYGGHEIAELALVKLYHAANKKKYLDLAAFFINERGKKPYYFDLEQGRKTDGKGYVYNQAHTEVRNQSEAVGHAVRGVYLYSGMADIAKLNGDNELYQACKKIWDNITQKKLYITGGIGSTVDGEAFSFDYDLPNDLAYCETCASIGLVFFAQRMLEINPDSSIADVMEKAIYNCILSGMSENGTEFFYVNPLEVLPEASRKDSRKYHVKPVRQKWYGCACCPPNLARFLCSIGEYCASENDSNLFIHQYVGGTYHFTHAELELLSDYIENGKIEINVNPSKPVTLAIRIPGWCRNYSISEKYELKNGYAYISVQAPMIIKAEFVPEISLIKCSNRVRENIGKVAVTRGAIVYCCEEIDNGADLQMLSINPDGPMEYKDGCITVSGFREAPDHSLYQPYSKQTKEENIRIRLIPYFKWANRGENEMTVYLRTKNI